MKTNNIDKRKIGIYILVLLLIILIIYLIITAFNHNNDDYIKKINDLNIKYTLDDNQLDKILLPKVSVKVTLDTLPKTNNTIEDIKINDLEKLFQTTKKSLVLLVKNGCSFCEEFEPRVKETLEKLKLNAYKINISNYTEDDMAKLFDFINFDGTPTMYIIENGKVNHTLSGSVDTETLISFIDYFYIRSN